jgi:predicted acetyltransferase
LVGSERAIFGALAPNEGSRPSSVGVDIRSIKPDEGDALSRMLFTAFGESATDEKVRDELEWAETDRLLGAEEDGRWVGAAGAYTFTMTLPGGSTLPVAGVTWVGVLPTHRRRGVLTAMMDFQLDDIAARGEAVAVLTASEAPIYGRFGYGLASRLWKVRIDTRGGLDLLAQPATGGRLRMIDVEEAKTVLPAVYDAVRTTRVGELSRPATWWDGLWRDPEYNRDDASQRFDVVHERAGVIDGYVSYRIKQDWDFSLHRSEVRTRDCVAADPEVEATLLAYLADIDLTTSVTSWARPVDDPFALRLADWRRYKVETVHDHLWARILDVPVAFSARRYDNPGTVVLAVEDAFRPAVGGRYRLTVDDDGIGTCERVGDLEGAADLRVDAPGLGSLLLGDVRPSQLVRAGRATASSPDVLTTADNIFPTATPPWSTMGF